MMNNQGWHGFAAKPWQGWESLVALAIGLMVMTGVPAC